LLASSDNIVGVARSLLGELWNIFPELEKKQNSCVIPNGAPLDRVLKIEPSAVRMNVPTEYLLTVGHLIHRKGIDVLIRALQLTQKRQHRMELVVVGDGSERAKLAELATNCGLSEQVHFVGDQPHDVVLGLLRNCLFFVLSSREEGLPLVIAEAMACGKAVVSTNVDGVPEIVVEGRTGLLVDPDDPEALADALIKVYTSPKLRESLAKRGRDRAVRSYTWEAIGHQYLDLFARITAT
jgi:glycosyltransferase involved in cell wall biosynthesis